LLPFLILSVRPFAKGGAVVHSLTMAPDGEGEDFKNKKRDTEFPRYPLFERSIN
jgi:hypothetical protein